ncbi:MAG: HNH endonuclease [Deltaproteobacteria bacterium]|nr:HNH endonuclease [Deltaproteobacteria bacterium]
MNGNKCSYCERLLAEPEQEVDHHVEVAECPERAFDWSNLYLSCAPCNSQKAPNRQVPVAACVDPCAPGVQPDAHLTFDDERIEARNASTHGRSTIQKYRLDWQDLDLARSKILNTFAFALDAIRQRQLVDGGRDLSDEEREILRAFATPARPFSLMMKLRLTRLSL